MAFNSPNERYREIDRILEQAIDLSPAERDAYVAAECGSNASMEHSIRRLLSLSGSLSDFLDTPAVADRPAIRVGDVLLGRFRIVEVLGEGGMGSVYLAEDSELGEVALKTLRPELRRDPASLDRFRAEIRMARTISHPNVCAIFEFFASNDSHAPAFFTMQYCAGETLAERLTRGPLPADEFREIAQGIAAGLDALHAEGIVHRDLKPSNIILRRLKNGTLRPVITDFGLADADHVRQAASAHILGSPDYMAPEQFRGSSVTKLADVFSFGVILFEMLAGARPYPREELFYAALRRVADDAPRLSSVREGTSAIEDDILARALARDPAVRFPSARAVVQALETLDSGRLASPLVLKRACRRMRRSA